MMKLPTLILLTVVAHWVIAIGHLFLAAEILPAPNNYVSWLAIVLITSGHLLVSLALWKLNDPFAAWVSLIFFLAALGADLYEHFLHVSGNNIFMAASTSWTSWFDASVVVLLALEILGGCLGIGLLRRGGKNNIQTGARIGSVRNQWRFKSVLRSALSDHRLAGRFSARLPASA